jgi:hypothetical protein
MLPFVTRPCGWCADAQGCEHSQENKPSMFPESGFHVLLLVVLSGTCLRFRFFFVIVVLGQRVSASNRQPKRILPHAVPSGLRHKRPPLVAEQSNRRHPKPNRRDTTSNSRVPKRNSVLAPKESPPRGAQEELP